MQEGGRRNGGGEDYLYLSIQEELGKLMSFLLKILFTCDEAIKSLSVGLEAYLMLQGWEKSRRAWQKLVQILISSDYAF